MKCLKEMTRWRPLVIASSLLLTTVVFAASPENARRHDRVLTFKGVPVTGINELCGKPVWTFDYPTSLPRDFHTPNFGQFDPRPGATESIPLTAANCKPDTVVATIVDPVFAAYIAVGPNDVDPRLKNLPIRSVPMPTFFASERATIPQLKTIDPATSPVGRFRSMPDFQITLGQWMKARAQLTIHCTAAGPATASATFRKLIPNGMYTVWGSWSTVALPGTPRAVVPIPFGGAPNSLVADHEGNATFQREFAACPLDPVPDAVGSKLLFVALVYHSDGVLFGASPGPFQSKLQFEAADGKSYESFAIPGIIIHDHLIFATSGSRIDGDNDNDGDND